MMPLDDELRALLTSRADALPPTAAPLAGIEARATRLRRTQVARSVAGTVLALGLVAVGVPAALGNGSSDSLGVANSTTATPTGPAPTTSPSPDSSPVPAVPTRSPDAAPSAPRPSTPPVPSTPAAVRPAGALAWPSSPLTAAQIEAYVPLWAAEHPGEGAVSGEVLLATTLPNQEPLRVLQLWRGTGPASVAFFTYAGGGPFMVRDEPVLQPRTVAYRAVVPGDETAFVAVVASPAVTTVEYAADGVTFDVSRVGRTAVFPRTGPTGSEPDLVRSLDAAGTAYAQPADPDDTGDGGDGLPANVLSDWPARGTAGAGPSLADARAAVARGLGSPGAKASLRPLFEGDDDAGARYVVGQAWLPGQQAHSFAYVTSPGAAPELFLGPVTPTDTRVLAFLVTRARGQSDDTLVVVPEPGTGQVMYGADDATEYVPAGAGQDSLDGVVLIDRSPEASTDRLMLLDGDGDLDDPTFEGDVADLLCGLKGCG